jgi:hypothetical protein
VAVERNTDRMDADICPLGDLRLQCASQIVDVPRRFVVATTERREGLFEVVFCIQGVLAPDNLRCPLELADAFNLGTPPCRAAGSNGNNRSTA